MPDTEALLTIAELASFQKDAESVFTGDERTALIDHLAKAPDAGTVIPGTGGLRKLRWGARQSG